MVLALKGFPLMSFARNLLSRRNVLQVGAAGVADLYRAEPDQVVGAIAVMVAEVELVVLVDNAEHVAVAAAELITALLGRCSRLVMLVTSREPLRTDAEWVHRLLPLDVPSTTSPSTGIFSPGRTEMRSPGTTSWMGTSASTPSRTSRAVRGCRPISLRIALARRRSSSRQSTGSPKTIMTRRQIPSSRTSNGSRTPLRRPSSRSAVLSAISSARLAHWHSSEPAEPKTDARHRSLDRPRYFGNHMMKPTTIRR